MKYFLYNQLRHLADLDADAVEAIQGYLCDSNQLQILLNSRLRLIRRN